MKIFLSHSGITSFKVAKLIKKWLPEVIQATEPWISDDIQKGERWRERLNIELNNSQIGIICLTKENLKSPWILFESGSLSRDKNAILCTFLIDLKPNDIKGPLETFQHTVFSKEDILKLLISINGKTESPLPDSRLEKAHNRLYSEFEKEMKEIIEKTNDSEFEINRIPPQKTGKVTTNSVIYLPLYEIKEDMSITQKIDLIHAQENWNSLLQTNTEGEIQKGIEMGYPDQYIIDKQNILQTLQSDKQRILKLKKSLGL